MAELVRTGIVRSDEAHRIGEEDSLDMFESNWFIPLKWSVEVIKGAQKEGLIKTPPGESIFATNFLFTASKQNVCTEHCPSSFAKILQNATARHQKAFMC